MSDINEPSAAKLAKADAKADKARAKALRPWFKKKRFLLPAGFVVLIVAITAMSGGGSTTGSQTAASTQTNAAQSNASTATATAKPSGPSIDDGTWIVGTDFPAGTYALIDEPSQCYWEITKSGSNGSDIVANANVSGGHPTVTLKLGQDFDSTNCGTWTSKPASAQLTSFHDGAWTVGRDIAPGRYRVTQPVSQCYWGITKAGTNGGDIIANNNVSGGKPSVTLKAGQEFISDGCGDWATM